MIHQNDKRKWICTAAGEFLRKNGTKNRFPHWKSIKQLNGAKGTALTAKKNSKKKLPSPGIEPSTIRSQGILAAIQVQQYLTQLENHQVFKYRQLQLRGSVKTCNLACRT
jgi:hypothetical protein